MQRFGEYLLMLRGSQSLESICKVADISPSVLYRLESGERQDLKVSTLVGLSKALKVNELKLIAAYKGEDPELFQDEQKYKAPLLELLRHLPDDLILEALKARPPQEVLKGLIDSKGIEKVQECLAEARRRQQEKSFE